MNTLSTQELISKIEENNVILIDVRPIAAYNGWTLQNEQRGGHVPSAKSIPLQWTQYMDWIEVLEEKNISREQPVVVYGYDNDDSLQMAQKLEELGYGQITTYNHFVEEYAGNPDLPLDKLPRYKHLVYPEWIKQLTASNRLTLMGTIMSFAIPITIISKITTKDIFPVRYR